MEIIICIIILLWAVMVGYYRNIYLFYKNKSKQLEEKNKAIQIAYDDYSRYQKAYTEYYRWVNNPKSILPAMTISQAREMCAEEFNELFGMD